MKRVTTYPPNELAPKMDGAQASRRYRAGKLRGWFAIPMKVFLVGGRVGLSRREYVNALGSAHSADLDGSSR